MYDDWWAELDAPYHRTPQSHLGRRNFPWRPTLAFKWLMTGRGRESDGSIAGRLAPKSLAGARQSRIFQRATGTPSLLSAQFNGS